MIKRTIATVIICAAMPTLAHASKYCQALGDYAYTVAKHRDEGVTWREFMDVIREEHGKVSPDMEEKAVIIVDAAFSLKDSPSQYRRAVAGACEKNRWIDK